MLTPTALLQHLEGKFALASASTAAQVASGSTIQQAQAGNLHIHTSSIPVAGSHPRTSTTRPAERLSTIKDDGDEDSDQVVIAFSSGSTPALSESERHKSVQYLQQVNTTYHSEDQSGGTLSPLKEYFKRRQGGDSSKTTTAATTTTTTDAEVILASLLLPSVKHKNNDSEERLYIASRNKVHRPRAQRKRTSSSGADRAERDRLTASNTAARRSSDFASPTSAPHSNMSSSLFGGGPSPSSHNTATAQQQQRAVNARDYGYPSSKQHSNSTAISNFSSPPHSASTGGGSSSGILSSPFSPANNGGPASSIRTGTSSKASQMLGLSSSHSPDMYVSQTATYQSAHSDGASTLNGNSRHHLSNLPSPSSSNGSGGREASSLQQPSHARMTLKKARSLFSSSGSGSKHNKERTSNRNSPETGLPSPTYGGPGPKGMGSYGDAYNSPPPLPGFYSTGQSTLSHSKSHGSLQGAMHGSARPSNPPALPSILGSGSGSTEAPYHPYAAASLRKASQPNLPSHKSRSASHTREQEEDVNCPVCLESLSIRLQGEKPHVVPLCGHKLHNECFETAYDITVKEVLGENNDGRMMEGIRRKKRQPIGICGICRSEMRIGDPSEVGKNSK